MSTPTSTTKVPITFVFTNLDQLTPPATVHVSSGLFGAAKHPVTAKIPVTLDEHAIKIGKVPSAHLQIEHPSVARMHAVIEGTEVYLIDLGSPFGCRVNGMNITRAPLRTGDVILIGLVEMAISITEVS